MNKKITQANLIEKDGGKVAENDGWYVVNASEAPWYKNQKFGRFCEFEGLEKFKDYGMHLHVLMPGEPNCHYHAEDGQENFFVLKGECKLLVENEERLLKEWDFVHCPSMTEHVFVGAGTGPCAILMVGSRNVKEIIYPKNDLAANYSASAKETTSNPKESYSEVPKSEPSAFKWPLDE